MARRIRPGVIAWLLVVTVGLVAGGARAAMMSQDSGQGAEPDVAFVNDTSSGSGGQGDSQAMAPSVSTGTNPAATSGGTQQRVPATRTGISSVRVTVQLFVARYMSALLAVLYHH